MTKPPEQHALNWDLRHEDFNDNDYLYDVYAVMRETSPFAHTDTPFLSATPGGAWVATRYAECHKILQDWQHFSSNPTPEGAEQLAGELADALGTELHDVRCAPDYAQTTEDLQLPGDWTIKAGCVAGIDVRWKGILNGREVMLGLTITANHLDLGLVHPRGLVRR